MAPWDPQWVKRTVDLPGYTPDKGGMDRVVTAFNDAQLAAALAASVTEGEPRNPR